ncbi:MAG TPA: RimK family protein, partial [Burkholderiales bacterium]|nr:RimK family protein [Burkholderiales bacterium]
NRQQEWPFEIAGSSAIAARAYLTDPAYSVGIDARLVNLCRCDRYQGRGYYVSLLAEARGHNPLPDVKTIEDLQSATLVDLLAAELQPLIQEALQNRAADVFHIDAYFGRDPTGLHPAVSRQLFALVKAPLLRAKFEQRPEGWRLAGVVALGIADVPLEHRALLVDAATDYINGTRTARVGASEGERPSIAILHDPGETEAPSNPAALERFVRAANEVGMDAEIIDRRALDRIAQFDALFIRDTTNVNHYTYEFSRSAAAHGLIVIDDPDSILKCTNKVYLNELMARHHVPVPKTLMVHPENIDEIIPALGLPCILKQPDSAFSLGVRKVETEADLKRRAEELLQESELIVAQQFLPTTFDWRVGVLDGRALYVCKYFMAPGHWQVIKRDTERRVEGTTVTISVGEAPEIVVRTALRAANLIGNGLYGVDLKQTGSQCYLIEVNDNPNIDHGNEDQVLKDALYREVMGVFARRVRERRRVLTL